MNPVIMQLVADRYMRLTPEEGISNEDVSTNSIVPEYKKDEVQLICREDGIVAGLQISERVFTLLDPETRVVFDVRDGEEIEKGQHLATVTGDVRVFLPGERMTLGYLQQLSGTATYTHTVAGISEGIRIRFLDTWRTTPCIRILKKYAARIGGGQDHRYNLSDGVLSKDNYIDTAGGVREAMTAAKTYAPFVRKIEVETENLDMVKGAVDAGADITILDNMTSEQMAGATRYINGRAEIECSDNMTEENIRIIIELGVDYVSSGTLTRSSPILDINLKHLKVLMNQTITTFCRRE